MSSKRLRFSAQNTDFVQELRSRVQSYFKQNNISQYGNANIAVKTAVMLTVYLVPFILMLSGVITNFWLMLLAWTIMGVAVAGVGMSVMHDASHKSFSKNQKLNKLMGSTLYLLGGFPTNWAYQHNTLHHSFTNVDGHDEDISPAGILRFSPHKPIAKIHRYQHLYAWFFYSLMTLSWVTVKDFKQLIRYKRNNINFGRRTFKGLMTELIIAKTFYYGAFLVLPIILLPVAWYWVVLYFVVMHFASGFILSVIFQSAHVMPDSEYPMPDTNGNLKTNWAIHQLLTTANFSQRSKIFSWFIGGLNYQIEHHLFPGVCHVHYPKLAPIVKQTAIEYNLPYHVNGNFISTLITHGRMLKQLGR